MSNINSELLEALKGSLNIIETLIASKKIVNLDEAIAYYKSLIDKAALQQNKVSDLPLEWSPVESENKWEEEQFRKLFPNYENDQQDWQRLNFFIDAGLKYLNMTDKDKVSDVSDEPEDEFELLLMIKNELFEADKLPFGKRVEANNDILNFVSIKRK